MTDKNKQSMQKTFSMSQWMIAMKEQGIGSAERLQRAIEQDFTKWERLKKLNELIGLPIDKHTHFSAHDMLSNAASVHTFFSWHKDALFSIKAEPTTEFGEQLPRHRAHGITQQQCVEFVQSLKPKPACYVISIWTYFESKVSGTMIVGDSGVCIEAIKGSHSILTQGFNGNVISGWYDYKTLSVTDDGVQSIVEEALDAIRLEAHSEIKTIQGLVAGYFEFLYNEGEGFRFIDYNTTSVMSSIEPTPSNGTGMAASKGSCKGRVCVVAGEKDFSHVQNGDILVTQMTDPSFVPVLTRVAGIITDFGGVTCHAAIIARELRIPCIVGTGNATSTLKNGEIVEMSEGKIRRM